MPRLPCSGSACAIQTRDLRLERAVRSEWGDEEEERGNPPRVPPELWPLGFPWPALGFGAFCGERPTYRAPIVHQNWTNRARGSQRYNGGYDKSRSTVPSDAPIAGRITRGETVTPRNLGPIRLRSEHLLPRSELVTTVVNLSRPVTVIRQTLSYSCSQAYSVRELVQGTLSIDPVATLLSVWRDYLGDWLARTAASH